MHAVLRDHLRWVRLSLVYSLLAGCQSDGANMATRQQPPKKRTLSISIEPIEAPLEDDAFLKHSNSTTHSSPPEVESHEEVHLDSQSIALDEMQHRLSNELKEVELEATKQTLAMHREWLERLCTRLKRELLKRGVTVTESNADVQVEVRLRELSVDSLNGLEFRAEATLNHWSGSSQGKSLDKIGMVLADQIAERLAMLSQ